jgi:hypothetical protein
LWLVIYKLNADPDPDQAYHSDKDLDPDPTYNFDADPDPTFYLMWIQIHNTAEYHLNEDKVWLSMPKS